MLTSVTMSIASHYAPTRLKYLAEVLKAAGEWKCDDVNIHVDTNDLVLADAAELSAATSSLRRSGVKLQFHEATGLEDPFHLTWVHKDRLREWVARGGNSTDLFIYVEDDIVLTQENLGYFSENLPILKKLGLIPGFLLYEVDRDRRMAVSYRGHQVVTDQDEIYTAGRKYVSPAFPYWAGLILDRELADEYLKSDSSQIERGPDIFPGHSCRVHSAMGLCFEDPPEPFRSRFVVPVNGLRPVPECQVWHCAQNYSRTKKHNFATITVSDIFVRPGSASAARRLVWKGGAMARYVKHAALRNAARAGLIKDRTYLDLYTTY